MLCYVPQPLGDTDSVAAGLHVVHSIHGHFSIGQHVLQQMLPDSACKRFFNSSLDCEFCNTLNIHNQTHVSITLHTSGFVYRSCTLQSLGHHIPTLQSRVLWPLPMHCSRDLLFTMDEIEPKMVRKQCCYCTPGPGAQLQSKSRPTAFWSHQSKTSTA